MATGTSCKILVWQDTSTRGGEWLNYLRLCENGRIAFFFTYMGSKTMNRSELWDLLALQKRLRLWDSFVWNIWGYETHIVATNGIVIVKGTGKWNDCFEFQTDNTILWGHKFLSTRQYIFGSVNYSKRIFVLFSIFYT